MSAELIRQEIEKIRKVVEAATTGPWRAGGDEGWPVGSFSTGNSGIDGKDYTVWTAPMSGSELGEADAKLDAEFIAQSRTTLPQALEALEALTKYLSENCYCYLSMAGLESTGGLIEPCSNCGALSTAASILGRRA